MTLSLILTELCSPDAVFLFSMPCVNISVVLHFPGEFVKLFWEKRCISLWPLEAMEGVSVSWRINLEKVAVCAWANCQMCSAGLIIIWRTVHSGCQELALNSLVSVHDTGYVLFCRTSTCCQGKGRGCIQTREALEGRRRLGTGGRMMISHRFCGLPFPVGLRLRSWVNSSSEITGTRLSSFLVF